VSSRLVRSAGGRPVAVEITAPHRRRSGFGMRVPQTARKLIPTAASPPSSPSGMDVPSQECGDNDCHRHNDKHGG
jgi:hypothetical protein